MLVTVGLLVFVAGFIQAAVFFIWYNKMLLIQIFINKITVSRFKKNYYLVSRCGIGSFLKGKGESQSFNVIYWALGLCWAEGWGLGLQWWVRQDDPSGGLHYSAEKTHKKQVSKMLLLVINVTMGTHEGLSRQSGGRRESFRCCTICRPILVQLPLEFH